MKVKSEFDYDIIVYYSLQCKLKASIVILVLSRYYK